MEPMLTNYNVVLTDEQGWERMKFILEEGLEEELSLVSLAQLSGG